MSKVIGIDLGTTNSCVASFQQDRPVIIPNQEGSTTTPSIVAFSDTHTRLVGSIAKRQIHTNPENTFYSVKRLIGRKYDSPEVAKISSTLSYHIAPAENNDVMVKIKERCLSIPEIQAEILLTMKKTAENYLGDSVNEAVITVPAYFNDAQRQATKDAGQIAGLKVLRIINEPTAASLAYGLSKSDRCHIAVYDLGGGTFDISILEIGDGVFEVKSTSGDTFLGGDDFDRRIIEYLISFFQQKEGIDLSKDKSVLQRLKEAAEEAKQILSSEVQTEINIPFITITPSGPKHLKCLLTRARLEELVEDLINRTLEPCRQALKDSNLKKEDIKDVVLVGGQTRMPKVREVVGEFFKREPHIQLNPDEVVAIGAAVQGAVLKGEFEEFLLLDVTPLTLGVETRGGLFTPFIERNTTIPTSKTLTFTTTEDNQSSVNVHVLQGERKMAADNMSLEQFELAGIAPSPAGMPKIEMTFDIDANGILSVTAKDLSTGQSQAVVVTDKSGLTEEDIKRIIQESEEHRLEDEHKQEITMLRNEAEAAIYSAENLIESCAQQLSAQKKEMCLQLINQLRVATIKAEKIQIEKLTSELRRLSNQIINSLI